MHTYWSILTHSIEDLYCWCCRRWWYCYPILCVSVINKSLIFWLCGQILIASLFVFMLSFFISLAHILAVAHYFTHTQQGAHINARYLLIFTHKFISTIKLKKKNSSKHYRFIYLLIIPFLFQEQQQQKYSEFLWAFGVNYR